MVNKSVFSSISDRIDKVIGYACIVFGMAMTVSTLTGILFRYVMINPLPWTEELARYTMIWMGLLAVSMGVKRETHLGLTLIVDKFPAVIRKVLKVVNRVLIGAFLFVLLIYGYKMAMGGIHQTMPALRLPMICVLIAVPISALVSLIQLLLISTIELLEKEA
jgi:TRAP-type C4-dicarboxylate transport system permease small subunit